MELSNLDKNTLKYLFKMINLEENNILKHHKFNIDISNI